MATSGTYAFDPNLAGILDEAFERCGIDPSSIVHRHIISARTSCEFMLSEWANRDVFLWKMERTSQALTAGLETYTLASGTLAVFDGVLRRSGADTECPAISRAEYMSIPNKTSQGLPTRVLFEKTPRNTSQITLWQVPENSTDTFEYYRLRRTEDAGTLATNNVDIPWEWMEAFASGLAAKLSLKFAFDRANALEGRAERSFLLAKSANRERNDTQMTYRSR